MLSDKRTDFIIRYGFVGPIILEVKLASNSDLKKKKLEESASYVSMGTYMNGYGASHGIFLIMDDTGKPKIIEVKEVFGKIPNVLAMSLDCYNIANAKKKVKKVTQSKKRKTKVVSRKKKTK